MSRQLAFAAMVGATEGPLRAYIAGIGVGRHAVDDIAQETFLAVWEREPPADVDALRWLKGIAKHKAMDHLRRASSRRQRLAELLAAPSIDPDPEDAPAIAALRHCLDDLLPRDRDLLDAHYRDEQSSDAIALSQAVTGSAVRKRLAHLRETLAACMRRRLGDAP